MKRTKAILLKAIPLSLGLSLSFVLLARVFFDLSFDRFYKDLERIYRIEMGISMKDEFYDMTYVSGGVAPLFAKYIPGVETSTRTTFLGKTSKFQTEDGKVLEARGNVLVVDTSFFKVFQQEVLLGNPSQVFALPGQVMISLSFAEKLGGVGSVVGKQIRYLDDREHPLTIGGVYKDFPPNGSIRSDVLVSMASLPANLTEGLLGGDRFLAYVKLQEGVDVSSLSRPIARLVDAVLAQGELETQGVEIHPRLVPFSYLHTQDPGVKSTMALLWVVSILLMLVSILNYLLSEVSVMMRRSPSFAVRKCFGAGTREIYGVLFKEASTVMGVALLLSVGVLCLLKPLLLRLLEMELEDFMQPSFLLILLSIVGVILLFTTVLPACMYLNTPVVTALRRFTGSRRIWKYTLLTFQFIVNVFLFGMLAVVISQYRKVMNQDTGYSYENVICVSASRIPGEISAVLSERFSGLAGVVDVIGVSCLPMESASGNEIYTAGQEPVRLFNAADQYYATQGFSRFFDIPMLEGAEPRTEQEVVVSRSFAEKLKGLPDWEGDVVGSQILVTEHSQVFNAGSAYTICGIYENYRIGSFYEEENRPSLRFYAGSQQKEDLAYILIRAEGNRNLVKDEVSRLVAEMVPESADADVFFYEDRMESLYADQKKMRDMFFLGCALSVLISLFGLMAYVGNEASRRSKEIAVRKINGASVKEIIGMFVTDILRLLAVAVVLGDTLVYLVSQRYLQQFPLRISVDAWHLIIPDMALVVLVVVSVIANSVHVALSDPSEYLKDE